MKLQGKIALILVGITLPYMCAVVAFGFYITKHPGPVPRSISVPLFCFFLLTIIGGAMIVSRMARKRARIETAEEGKLRRARAVKGLKAGLVVWGLILLNGIRLVAQHEIPWAYAIPGLTVDVLLVVVFWTSLKRLKKFETKAEADQQHT